MLRRSVLRLSLAAGLLAVAGCLCLDEPILPRLRSLLPGGNGCCPPEIVSDVDGPILEGAVVGAPPGPPAEGMAPQPRVVPQPLTAPEAERTPYKPAKKGK